MVTFLYGCAATFAGVFVISSSSPSEASSESTPEEEGENTEHRPGAGEESERRRPALVLTPNLNIRHRQSAVSLMGLSNAHVSFPFLLLYLALSELLWISISSWCIHLRGRHRPLSGSKGMVRQTRTAGIGRRAGLGRRQGMFCLERGV